MSAPPPPLYLDANATEPLRPEARAAAVEALDTLGNPSSVHADGRAARRLLERARARVAAAVGAARASDVVFASGGTEADALGVHALGAGRRVLVGATEHAAVLAAAGPGAARLRVRRDGTADLDALDAALADGPPALVCLMMANNETGVLHPVVEAGAICRARGALLLVDAAQALGRVPVSLAALGADALALSGHKVGGPKGAGALVLRAGLGVAPLVAGGGQERGRRGGTEALPAICGMGAAAEAAVADLDRNAPRLAAIRRAMEDGAGLPVAGGDAAERLPNTTCLVLPPGASGETGVIALDLAGVRVSSGAACSSGKVARSHVLDAMGFGEAAGRAIRVSLPWDAPDDAAGRFLAALRAAMRGWASRAAA